MGKLIYSVSGTVLFGTACIVATWLMGSIFGSLYQGEDESSRNFKIFLFAFFSSIFLGAIIGFFIANKGN